MSSVFEKPCDRLLGQAVDQVDADGVEAELARFADQPQRVGYGLDAVHRFLHGRVEVLDAEAAAIEADAIQIAQGVGRDRARVELDRILAAFVRRKLEMLPHLLDQPLDFERRQERGCATAEVQLFHDAVAIVEITLHLDFAMQAVQVRLGLFVVAGDDLGAAAVEAGARAERNVHVQRQRARDGVLVAGHGDGPVLVDAETVRELHRGGVRRVARTRAVVAAD